MAATAFDTAYRFIRFGFADWHGEGGYTAPRPGDPNPTNYGITQDFYDDLCRGSGLTQKPVSALTEDEAKQVYTLFWRACHCDTLPDAVAIAYWDAAFNMGQGAAIRQLQRALGVPVDGALGPQTIGAAQAADPRQTVIRLTGQRVAAFRDIAAKRPEKARFLNGWLNRVTALQKLLKVA